MIGRQLDLTIFECKMPLISDDKGIDLNTVTLTPEQSRECLRLLMWGKELHQNLIGKGCTSSFVIEVDDFIDKLKGNNEDDPFT
jgi:hypothetical protein